MFSKGVTSIFLYLVLFSATIRSVTLYGNAQFDPIDTRFTIGQQFSVISAEACICECFNSTICFTANYFGVNQTCSLFFAQLDQGQLRVVPSIMDANVYFLGSTNSNVGQKIFNRTNETIEAIWNTTTGGDSTPAISGYSTGTYWPTEPPAAAFDNNFASQYTNHGNCNSTRFSLTCGVNTGLYFTLNSGPFTLVAFYFVTNFNHITGDPLTITIEGSNQNTSALTLGSSWMLIYNGSAGLINDPGRSNMGAIQTLPNSPIPFTSYRLLVTSQRGYSTCTSYSEFIIIIGH